MKKFDQYSMPRHPDEPKKFLLEKGRIHTGISHYMPFELHGHKYEIEVDIDDNCVNTIEITELNEVLNTEYHKQFQIYLTKKQKYEEDLAEWNVAKKIFDAERQAKDLLERERLEKKCLNNLKRNMKNKPNYYITGGFGMIGSALVKFLNSKGIRPYIIQPFQIINDQWKNLAGADFEFFDFCGSIVGDEKDFLIHLGANVTTTEPFNEYLWENNVQFSLRIINSFSGKIIYASSAAIYGMETVDFSEDNWNRVPLNPYAFTKFQLDKQIFQYKNLGFKDETTCALRFFNVYSAAERHKGNMSSVIFKWLNDDKLGIDYGDGQLNLKLFKSLRSDYLDGEQKRDFIYVGDICKVIWFITQKAEFASTKFDGLNFRPGIFNLGSGAATTWNTVAKNVLKVRGLPDSLVEYVDMPDNLKKQYQYYTCADLTKLREVLGYKEPMTTIEEGIKLTWEELNK